MHEGGSAAPHRPRATPPQTPFLFLPFRGGLFLTLHCIILDYIELLLFTFAPGQGRRPSLWQSLTQGRLRLGLGLGALLAVALAPLVLVGAMLAALSAGERSAGLKLRPTTILIYCNTLRYYTN